MEDKDRREILEKTFDRLHARIGAADAKFSPLVFISTTMFTVLIIVFNASRSWNQLAVAAGVAGVIALLGIAAAMVMGVTAIIPRRGQSRPSLVFFEGIKGEFRDSYIARVKGVTDEAYFLDLAEQCHELAAIAHVKFNWVRRSMLALGFSLPLWIFALAVLYNRS